MAVGTKAMRAIAIIALAALPAEIQIRHALAFITEK